MTRPEIGTHTAAGQPDIVIVDNGELRSMPGQFGPWIVWRFSWETNADAIPSLCTDFGAMYEQAGYTLKT